MKKKLSLFICLAMLAGILCGCGESACVGFFSLYDQMQNVTNGNFTQDVKLTVTPDFLNMLSGMGIDMSALASSEGDSVFTVGIKGSLSSDNKQMLAECSLSYGSGENAATVKLTDMIIDGNKLYINLNALLTSLESITGQEGLAENALAVYNGAEYLMIDYQEDYGIDIWGLMNAQASGTTGDEGTNSLNEAIGKLTSVVTGYVEGAQDTVFSKSGGKYILALNQDDMVKIASSLCDTIINDCGYYYDSLLSYAISSNPDTYGDLEGDEDSRQASIDSITSTLENLKATLAATNPENLPKLNLSCSMSKKSEQYISSIAFSWDGMISLSMDVSIEDAAVTTAQAPENYVSYADLLNMEYDAYYNFNDVQYTLSSYDESVSSTVEVPEGYTCNYADNSYVYLQNDAISLEYMYFDYYGYDYQSDSDIAAVISENYESFILYYPDFEVSKMATTYVGNRKVCLVRLSGTMDSQDIVMGCGWIWTDGIPLTCSITCYDGSMTDYQLASAMFGNVS